VTVTRNAPTVVILGTVTGDFVILLVNVLLGLVVMGVISNHPVRSLLIIQTTLTDSVPEQMAPTQPVMFILEIIIVMVPMPTCITQIPCKTLADSVNTVLIMT
jgi:hypothetical protein